MLLDKTMVENVIRNSKDKEAILKTLEHLPNMEDGQYSNIQVSYDLTIRGSQISNTFCNATAFIDSAGHLWISMYDNERCSGATLIMACKSNTRDIRDLCNKALGTYPIKDMPKQEEKDIVDIRESKVIDLLNACIGQRFERKDMIPIHQGVLDFYSIRGKVKKLTGLQTTRFNAIISTLGYIQKSSYLDSVSGKRVYYIEKINN